MSYKLPKYHKLVERVYNTSPEMSLCFVRSVKLGENVTSMFDDETKILLVINIGTELKLLRFNKFNTIFTYKLILKSSPFYN
jgi:hypothetical protein